MGRGAARLVGLASREGALRYGAYSDENTPLSDYEEKQWLLTEKSRDAVAIALTAMMDSGEITRPRAIEIARMVFRENALKLYRLAPDTVGSH
jgi:hypothetical protein